MNWLPNPHHIDQASFLWGMGYGAVVVIGLAWYIWLVYSVVNK